MRQALTSACLSHCCQSQRSSSRARQAPVHYAEEQAQIQLHAAELLDLRRAEAASLESDVEQESPDERVVVREASLFETISFSLLIAEPT